MIKVIILDQDENSNNILEEKLGQYKDIYISGKYTEVNKAKEAIQFNDPHVVFMDVEINGESGIEFAEKLLQNNPELRIVFISECKEHALEAFDIGAIDYVVKPIDDTRFSKTIEKVRTKLDKDRSKEHALAIKSFSSFHLIVDGDHIVKWRTRKAKELFTYLWLNSDISVSREVLLEKVFPSESNKKSSTLLSTTLYQMRQVLSEFSEKDFVKYLNNGYRFEVEIPSDFQTVKRIIESEIYTIENYRSIQTLYTGSFLQEEGYEWSERFAEQFTLKIKHYLLNFEASLKDEDQLLVEDILLFVYNLDPIDESVAIRILEFYKKHDSYRKYNDFSMKHIAVRGEENVSSSFQKIMAKKYTL